RSERDKLQSIMLGLAHAEICIDIIGIDYKILFQNQTLEERFGDLAGKLCYEEYMELKSPCDICPMIKAVKNRKLESAELTAADGRTYELLSAPIPNPDGTVDKAIEVIKDITERKRAEEEQRRRAKHFRKTVESIFEFVPEGVLAFTDKMNLFKKNKSFIGIVQKYAVTLGYTEEELTEVVLEKVKQKIKNQDHSEITIFRKQ
ncbi:unnamed protein product, partial [marine sediment metagenome]